MALWHKERRREGLTYLLTYVCIYYTPPMIWNWTGSNHNSTYKYIRIQTQKILLKKVHINEKLFLLLLWLLPLGLLNFSSSFWTSFIWLGDFHTSGYLWSLSYLVLQKHIVMYINAKKIAHNKIILNQTCPQTVHNKIILGFPLSTVTYGSYSLGIHFLLFPL